MIYQMEKVESLRDFGKRQKGKSPWNCIFNFANNKNFFWPIRSISSSKNVFVFRNSYTITYFKFRIFFIRTNIEFGIRIRFNIYRFYFDSIMVCVIMIFNKMIENIKTNNLWISFHVFVNLISQSSNKSFSNNRFSFMVYLIHFYVIVF